MFKKEEERKKIAREDKEEAGEKNNARKFSHYSTGKNERAEGKRPLSVLQELLFSICYPYSAPRVSTAIP